jgi:hypothetical protein
MHVLYILTSLASSGIQYFFLSGHRPSPQPSVWHQTISLALCVGDKTPSRPLGPPEEASAYPPPSEVAVGYAPASCINAQPGVVPGYDPGSWKWGTWLRPWRQEVGYLATPLLPEEGYLAASLAPRSGVPGYVPGTKKWGTWLRPYSQKGGTWLRPYSHKRGTWLRPYSQKGGTWLRPYSHKRGTWLLPCSQKWGHS